MKKGVVFAGLMMVSTIMFAQGGRRHGGYAMDSKRIDRMKSELSLTDDQVAKMKTINEKFVKSFEQLRKDTMVTVAASRARARKLVADQQTEIKAVLTPAQQTKWAEIKAKRKEDRKEHGGSHHRGYKR